MYTVQSIEHIEDWFVAEYEAGCFETLDAALLCLVNECTTVIDDEEAGSGIENYLNENPQEDDDNDFLEDCSKGFSFNIAFDDGQIVFLHIDYDLRAHSIVNKIDLEIADNALEFQEISKIRSALLALTKHLKTIDQQR